MEAALRKLCADVEAAVQQGCEVLVLSDRLPDGEEVRASSYSRGPWTSPNMA